MLTVVPQLRALESLSVSNIYSITDACLACFGALVRNQIRQGQGMRLRAVRLSECGPFFDLSLLVGLSCLTFVDLRKSLCPDKLDVDSLLRIRAEPNLDQFLVDTLVEIELDHVRAE